MRTPPIAAPQAVLSMTTIAFSARLRAVDMDDAGRAEFIGESKHVFHVCLHLCRRAQRSAMTARRKRAASPPVTAR